MAVSKNYDVIEADLAGIDGVLDVSLYDDDNLFKFLDYMVQHLYDPQYKAARQMGAWIALSLRHRHECIDNTTWNGKLSVTQLNQLKNAYAALQLKWPYAGMPQYVSTITLTDLDEKTTMHCRHELSKVFAQKPEPIITVNCADIDGYIIDVNCLIHGANQDLTAICLYGSILLCRTVALKLSALGRPIQITSVQLKSEASQQFPAQINMETASGNKVVFDINNAFAEITQADVALIAAQGLAAIANLTLSSLASLRIGDRWYSPTSFKEVFRLIYNAL